MLRLSSTEVSRRYDRARVKMLEDASRKCHSLRFKGSMVPSQAGNMGCIAVEIALAYSLL